MKVKGQNGKYTTHVLFVLLLFAGLIFTVLGNSNQVVMRGLIIYTFILTTVYSGRLCFHQIFVKRNYTHAVVYSLLMLTIFSLAAAWYWTKFFTQDVRFHSELLTITMPLTALLMAVGIFFSLITGYQRIKRSQLPKQLINSTIEEPANYIFIKSGGKLFKILYQDLVYAEASRNYTKAFIEDQVISTALPFSSFEKLLPINQFIRVHRSFIINKSKITHIEGNRIFINKYEIPIGESYKELLFQVIGLTP